MNRRINILQQSIRKLTLGGSLRTWLYNCLCPTCDVLAKRQIEHMRVRDGYYEIKLKDEDTILYCDASLSLHSLYQTISEQRYDWQWHYYTIPQTCITKDDIVFDCGSAEGVFTLLNHRRARHIYAFEPLPEYISGLTKTFNNVNNVTVSNIALGDHCGEAFLKKAGISSCIVPYKTDTIIHIDTIDNYCNSNNLSFSYLKADLEGYELHLLKGASESIARFRPKIAITTYHDKTHAMEISKLLRKLNPRYKIITKGILDVHGIPIMLHAA